MARWTLLLVLAALLAGCGGDPGPYRAPGQKGCDDGGSGGVMIDGVCL